MTLFAAKNPEPREPGRTRRRSSSLRAKTNQDKRDRAKAPTPATAPTVTLASLELSPAAQALYDDVSRRWNLTTPVAALLRLACEAMTKAAQAEEITSREGLTIGDAKGAAKPHPAALLARDYRAQASGALQRLLAHLEA